jgi:glucokinase
VTHPGRGVAVGLDVGGTKVLGVVIDRAGTIVAEARRPTPRGADAVVDTLAATVDDLAEQTAEPVAELPVGVGMPGLITTAGVLVSSPNLPDVIDLHVGRQLQERLGRAVTVSNDATCAVLAEWRAGVGRGLDDLVMVTLGTGIGGGVVAGGRLVVGAHGFTGEFGHMVVDPHGLPCPCGRHGCWERYASGSGLANLARVAAIGGRLRRVVALAGGDPQAVRGEHVHQAAAEGDTGALAVVDDFARWVALGLANLTNAFDPAAFVLGGGLAEGAALYLAPIDRWFHALLYEADLRPCPALSFAELGEQAGAIGAAFLAADRLS